MLPVNIDKCCLSQQRYNYWKDSDNLSKSERILIGCSLEKSQKPISDASNARKLLAEFPIHFSIKLMLGVQIVISAL